MTATIIYTDSLTLPVRPQDDGTLAVAGLVTMRSLSR
jgi:hypothetical protein